MKGRLKTKLIVLIALLAGGQSALAETSKNKLIASNNVQTQQHVFNLNQVNLNQLVSIKGLGPSKARAILEYRQKVGKFKTVDELRGIKGIGPKLFSQLKPKFRL